MTTPTTPSELAREALKRMALQKLAPTPDHYARAYQEISGSPPPAEGSGNAALPWPALIRSLLKQLDTPHKGISITRKKDGLETVLSKFSSNPETLFQKLQSLVNSWAEAPTTANLADAVALTPEPAAASAPSAAPSAIAPGAKVHAEMVAQLRELLAQTLESSLGSQPEMADEIRALAQMARAASDHDQTMLLSKKLRQYWIKMELRDSDKAKIQEGVVRLLRLLVDNVGELASDDQWLHGQITTLQEIIARPMDKRTIADAERNLRNAIIKQGFLKQSLVDAKTTLKNLMTTFIDRLDELSESTGEYHNKLETYSQKLGKTDNIAELSHLLEDIMQDTRIIQASALAFVNALNKLESRRLRYQGLQGEEGP
jgi:diguanylate cyclase